jgi:chaperonin GroEL (HSP60 family)
MSSKRLLFKSAAREKVLSGATSLAYAVRITLAPKSKSVLIQKKWGRAIVCNDDITLAKENSSVDGGVVVDRMKAGTGNYGFDGSRCEYVDLVAAGIIDLTKVVRIALENVVSVASVLLLAEATLTELHEEKKRPLRRTIRPNERRAKR